jgi:hypothetical protein
MTTNFVATLKAEIAELEAEIRNDPRHRKLQRLREALTEYEPGSKLHQAAGVVASTSSPVDFPAKLERAIARTKEEKIRAELTRVFKERGPQHRSDLLDHLTAIGLMGHEKDPMANLAAYLSNWKDIFDFDGKGRWGLRGQLEHAAAE